MGEAFAPEFQRIGAVLRDARSVLLACHEHPDCDAAGSALAILHALSGIAPAECTLYAPGIFPSQLNFLPDSHLFVDELPREHFDAAIGLDYGDFARLRLPEHISFGTFITIDHHPRSGQLGDIQIVAPEFSSTAEIVYQLFLAGEYPIDQSAAVCLLAGIAADTGGFRHASVSAETMRVAADLAERGANISGVLRRIIPFQGIGSQTQAAGKILSRVRIETRTGLAYSWMAREDREGFVPDDFGPYEMPTLIASASPLGFGLFLTEEAGGAVRGSLRSEPYTGKDVNTIARALGGGGHRYAAGFHFKGTLREALQKVLELI